MKGYITDIEKATVDNTDYRRVLYTAKHCQLVLMSIAPGEEIGAEVHQLDQFIRLETGEGKAVLNGVESVISANSVVIVPEGALHNIINTGAVPMKLYSVYSPPNHKDGTVHKTKADEVEEHFDGVTTE